MVGRHVIDKLKRMGPKRTVATGASADGSHPVPLDLSMWRNDLIDYNLFIGDARIIYQMLCIIPHLPYMEHVPPTASIINGQPCVAFDIVWPEVKKITLALGAKLENEYWALQVPGVNDESDYVLDLNKPEVKPHHMVGVTSDW